jgi:hypothetical protein
MPVNARPTAVGHATGNDMRPEGATAFASALLVNSDLTELDVSGDSK